MYIAHAERDLGIAIRLDVITASQTKHCTHEKRNRLEKKCLGRTMGSSKQKRIMTVNNIKETVEFGDKVNNVSV